MLSDWQEYKFENLLSEPVRNGIYKKKEFHGRGARIVNMGELFGHSRLYDVEMKRVELFDREQPKVLLQRGDLLFARRSLTAEGAGKCSIIKEVLEPTTFESSIIRARPNSQLANPDFLYYLFSSPYGKYLLGTIRRQVAVAGITGTDLKELKLKVPPLPAQKAIAHILGSLDDKIELNRKMNETLEAMAKALFKSWFVDFDPVIDNAILAGNPLPAELREKLEVRKLKLEEKYGSLAAARQTLANSNFPAEFIETEELGLIPKGWGVGPLGNFITVKRGGSPRPIHDFLVSKGLPWVKISDATGSNNRFISETKQYIKPEGLKKTVLLKKGSLILSNSATPGLPKFLNIDACIHDGWLHFPTIAHFSSIYLYQLFLILRKELILQGNGSVFTNLKTDILRNQVVLVPTAKTIQQFDKIVNIIFDRMNSLNSEQRYLSKLRDTLLPKLLSGELRRKDAEKLVEKIV